MPRIISFDCATKSLGVSIIKYGDFSCIFKKIKQYNLFFRQILKGGKDIIAHSIPKIIQMMSDHISLIESIMSIEYVNVFDLIPGEKMEPSSPLSTQMFKISSRLRSVLNALDSYVKANHGNIDVALLEYQMGPNNGSRKIMNEIIYHYSEPDHNFVELGICSRGISDGFVDKIIGERKINIQLVGASRKNKIKFSLKLDHRIYIAKYMSGRVANKQHAADNLRYLLEVFGKTEMISDLAKKYVDDAGDSVLMSFAWIFGIGKKN